MLGEMVPSGSPNRTSIRESVPVAARNARTPAKCENTNATVTANVVRMNSRRFMWTLPYGENEVNDFSQRINIRLHCTRLQVAFDLACWPGTTIISIARVLKQALPMVL